MGSDARLGDWVLERRRGVNQERVPGATEARPAGIFPQSCHGSLRLHQASHAYNSVVDTASYSSQVENDPCLAPVPYMNLC